MSQDQITADGSASERLNAWQVIGGIVLIKLMMVYPMESVLLPERVIIEQSRIWLWDGR